jgi:hypothetical protein
VTVWIYEDSLRVEKEAVTLSQYEIKLQEDRKHVQAVGDAQARETPFRSPKLTLFDLGPDGRILYWKTERAPTHHRRSVPSLLQLPLFDLATLDIAVGDDTGRVELRPRTHLHLVGEPPEGQGTEE